MTNPSATALFKPLITLIERFGSDRVMHLASNGKVFIEMPLTGGGTYPVGLNWQQARCLALHPEIRGEDVRDLNLPADWPQ